MFNTKMASLLFIIIISTWSFAADTTDLMIKISSQQDSIEKHLNQVEVKLDKVLIELSNRSAVEAVKNLTKTWGKGTSFGINVSSFQMIEAQLGYSFYKSNRSTRSVHIGYNQRLQMERYNHSDDLQHFIYINGSVRTPILFNFLSFGVDMGPIFFIDRTSMGGKNSQFGLGLGTESQFWFSPKSYLNLGIEAMICNRQEITDTRASKGTFTAYKINIGYTYYPKFSHK